MIIFDRLVAQISHGALRTPCGLLRGPCKQAPYPHIEIVFKFCFGVLYFLLGQKLGLPGRDPGADRYREVREAYRNRFHLFSSRLARVARSYDQKTKKVNNY